MSQTKPQKSTGNRDLDDYRRKLKNRDAFRHQFIYQTEEALKLRGEDFRILETKDVDGYAVQFHDLIAVFEFRFNDDLSPTCKVLYEEHEITSDLSFNTGDDQIMTLDIKGFQYFDMDGHVNNIVTILANKLEKRTNG